MAKAEKGKAGFNKFITPKEGGARKKEKIKQEKKAEKKEREDFFIEKKRKERADKKMMQEQQGAQLGSFKKKGRAPFNKSEQPSSGAGKYATKKPFDKTPAGDKPENKTPGKQAENRKPFTRPDSKPATQPRNSGIARTSVKPEDKERTKTDKPFTKDSDRKAPASFKPRENKKPFAAKDGADKEKKTFSRGLPYERKPLKQVAAAPAAKPSRPAKKAVAEGEVVTGMPLNKFLAHAGVTSRRDAVEIIKSAKVQVNGVQITEPGFKVQDTDTVTVNGKKLSRQKNLVYILLNKPKDFITTVEDPQGRKTVLDIIKTATTERVYPVGRLDRNTSGVLILTNDGDLAQQLTHPSFEVRKIYEAKLDKPLSKADFDKLLNGIELEDGIATADSLAYADAKDKSVIGIEIHNGRNRIVRRMFEHLGYEVKNLDRVMFANLTKKNVDRGKWRFLNEKEVRLLKYFNKSKQR